MLSRWYQLVMEKTQRRVSKNDSVLVRRLDALLVHDTSGRRGEISNAALLCAMNVIWEREKCVAGACHAIELPRVVRALLSAKRWGGLLE